MVATRAVGLDVVCKMDTDNGDRRGVDEQVVLVTDAAETTTTMPGEAKSGAEEASQILATCPCHLSAALVIIGAELPMTIPVVPTHEAMIIMTCGTAAERVTAVPNCREVLQMH